MDSIVRDNARLDHLNSFGVPAAARYFAEITSEAALGELFGSPYWAMDRLVLGGGSNVLFTKDFAGLVVKMAIPGITHEIQGSEVLVTAGGGVVWNDLVWYCVERGFSGIENLALIPGTAGAAPVQNIGAYGVELMDVFDHCRVFDTQSGEIITLFEADCGFTYRNSIFKSSARGRYIITTISLKLSTVPKLHLDYGALREELANRAIDEPSIEDIARVVSVIRTRKLPDPSTIGNAGSFFKNPVISSDLFSDIKARFPDIVHYPQGTHQVKLAAGWLIERCGWKGKRIGSAGTWKNQALVLVNHGGGTGPDIFCLSEAIIADVEQKFGITLEREVVVI